MFIIGIIWLLVRWRRKVRQRRYSPQSIVAMSIPFYARLLQLLAKRGWKPQQSQTPAEFAVSVGEHLQKEKPGAQVSEIPAAIVPPYYAVRYGGQNLNQQEQTAVDRQLQALQVALGQ